MATSIKRKLQKLRDEVATNGTSKDIRDRALAIYRKRAEYITKADLLLFGIIEKKS